ncbi:MAG: adenylate/guanylate cyclase domain-containing protein [Actinomycetota bacterium]|nr:adenylate/guanylate cyclase domain-containing protein [Actinomycetota bacterium]
MHPDEESWRVAGLLDAPDLPQRLALLAYLTDQGCSLDDMLIADGQGRLFALAGDRFLSTGTPAYDLSRAAGLLEVPADEVLRIWRALGLPDPVGASLSLPDVEALRTVIDVGRVLGPDAAAGLSRVLGALMARLAEAESAAMRIGLREVQLGVTGSELVTAQAYSHVAALVPRIGALLDVAHRHHLHVARRHVEAMDAAASLDGALRCGVGFADLSGFTRLAQQASLGSLSQILTRFEETASDEVHARGGRVVKFLGDAVMFVAPQPSQLIDIAWQLTVHPRALEAGIAVRAGLSYGSVLMQDGDYFGPPVNLAARLVAVAEAGQVLVADGLESALGEDWETTALPAQLLRGLDEPVVPYAVRPARSGSAPEVELAHERLAGRDIEC